MSLTKKLRDVSTTVKIMLVFLTMSLLLAASVFKMTSAQMVSDSALVFSNSLAKVVQEVLNSELEKTINSTLKDMNEDESYAYEKVSVTGNKSLISGLPPKIEEMRTNGDYDKEIAMLRADMLSTLTEIPIDEYNQLRNPNDSTLAFYDLWLFNAQQEVIVKAVSKESTYTINMQELQLAYSSESPVVHEQDFPSGSLFSSLILPKQQQLFHPLFADNTVVSVLVVTIPKSRFDYFTNHHYDLSVYILTLILIGLLLFYYLTKYISKDHRELERYIDRLSKGDVPSKPIIKQRRLAIGIGKLRKSLVKISKIDEGLQDKSHDIYNKVYNIQTTANNILRTDNSDQQKKFINNIKLDAADIETGIEKIIMQAKGDTREHLASPEPISSRKLIANVLTDSGVMDGIKKKKINLKTSNLGIEIKVQYDDVIQAIINVVRNAITATSVGSTIEIKLQHTNKWTRICILDAGPGIPHNFSIEGKQLNQDNSNSHGLGLKQVMRVMRRHEGEFQLRNRAMIEGAEAVLKFPKY